MSNIHRLHVEYSTTVFHLHPARVARTNLHLCSKDARPELPTSKLSVLTTANSSNCDARRALAARALPSEQRVDS